MSSSHKLLLQAVVLDPGAFSGSQRNSQMWGTQLLTLASRFDRLVADGQWTEKPRRRLTPPSCKAHQCFKDSVHWHGRRGKVINTLGHSVHLTPQTAQASTSVVL